jgi:hypothetical protein
MNEKNPQSIIFHPGPQEEADSPQSIPTPYSSLKNAQGQKDMIIQETKVLQQILGKFPDRGNQINVINIGQIVEKDSGKSNGSNGSAHSFDLWAFIDSLPHPRLQNAILAICQETEKRFLSQEKAATYLGITRRILSYNLKAHPKIGGLLARPKIEADGNDFPQKAMSQIREEFPASPTHPPKERKGPNTGRQLSEETKRRMAEARRKYWEKKKPGIGI